MICYSLFSPIIGQYILFDLNLFEKFAFYFNNRLLARFLFSIPLCILQIFPICIILRIRNQNLKSIGFIKNNLLKQFILGIIFSIPLISVTIVINYISGIKLNFESISIWSFLYMFVNIALPEEIIFRGFIPSRLGTLIKNKYLNILCVSFIFGVIHIPFMLAQYKFTTIELIIAIIPKSLYHIYFSYLYKLSDNSILSPTIAHALNNLIATL